MIQQLLFQLYVCTCRKHTESLTKLEERKRQEYNQLLLQMRADITQQHTRDQQQQQQHFQQCLWEMQNADQGNSKNLAAQLDAAQLQLKSIKAQHQAAVSNLELQVKQLSDQVRRLLHHSNHPSLCLSV